MHSLRNILTNLFTVDLTRWAPVPQVVLTRLCGCDKLLQAVSMQLAQLQADKVCHTNRSHTLIMHALNITQIFLPALSLSSEEHWVRSRNQMVGEGRWTTWRAAGSIPEGFASGGAGYTQSQNMWFVIGTVLIVCVRYPCTFTVSDLTASRFTVNELHLHLLWVSVDLMCICECKMYQPYSYTCNEKHLSTKEYL